MAGRQMNLFASRGARGRQAPSGSEFQLQCMVADTLKRWAAFGWRWTHVPLGEERTAAAGVRLKRMGAMRGWPDLILLAPAGHGCPRPHFLELKRRGGRLSEAQAVFARWCHANECPFAIAESYKDAVAILGDWGALQMRVQVQ